MLFQPAVIISMFGGDGGTVREIIFIYELRNVKLSLCSSKTSSLHYEEAEVKIHTSLTLALDASERQAS
jgi:hypothetical protein